MRGTFLGQRLGGDDVTAGGQYLAAELLLEFIQMRVATEHQTAGADAAGGAAHFNRFAVDDLLDRALLENAYTEGRRQTRFALHQIQRVQMAGAHVDQTTGVAVGVDHLLANLLGADQLGLMAVAEFVEADLFVLERRELRRVLASSQKPQRRSHSMACSVMRWLTSSTESIPARCR